jgi:hypothetical protein
LIRPRGVVAGAVSASSFGPAFVVTGGEGDATTRSFSISGFLIAFAFALALMFAGAAILPTRMLVGPASRFVVPRRELLFAGGVAVAVLIEIIYVVGGS